MMVHCSSVHCAALHCSGDWWGSFIAWPLVSLFDLSKCVIFISQKISWKILWCTAHRWWGSFIAWPVVSLLLQAGPWLAQAWPRGQTRGSFAFGRFTNENSTLTLHHHPPESSSSSSFALGRWGDMRLQLQLFIITIISILLVFSTDQTWSDKFNLAIELGSFALGQFENLNSTPALHHPHHQPYLCWHR